MAIEIEKKYRIDKKLTVEIAARLAALEATFAYDIFEENYLHRGGILDERGAVLRLRKVGDVTTLTYKEKIAPTSKEKINGGSKEKSLPSAIFKQQIEHETTVSNVEAMESIFECLGFTLAVIYEKHRRAWRFGNVEVTLDDLPFGYYMEIEGAIEDIIAAEKALGVENIEHEGRGYPRLTQKYGKEINGVFEARFEQN